MGKRKIRALVPIWNVRFPGDDNIKENIRWGLALYPTQENFGLFSFPSTIRTDRLRAITYENALGWIKRHNGIRKRGIWA